MPFIRWSYVGLSLFLLIRFWAFWTPDLLFIMLLVGFILWGQAVEFIKKFVPFLVLLLSYEALRGFANHVNNNVHFDMMINWDRSVFGQLPTSWLQSFLYLGHLAWYDFFLYGLYMMHFIVPIAIALWFWKKKPKFYSPFLTGLLLMSYAGFVTYIIYPAAPPWMASDMGLIEPIRRISSDVWAAWGVNDFPSLYDKFAPNPVAAVPSLHAAYPLLMWLFIRKAYPKNKWLVWGFFAYPALIWFGIVYLGEHYVIDVVLGIIYAVVAYLLTVKFFNYLDSKNLSLSAWALRPLVILRKKLMLR
ncbi:MAG: phosphatase PAP2 family protein [Patescibacteria group bacterium]